jgi:protein subunit release factor B
MSSSPSTRRICIPEGAIELKFIRSSGPGGQKVNKTSSACEGRFSIPLASWLPPDVKQRLLSQQQTYINSKSELIVASEEERSQHQNRARVFAKMQVMIDQCVGTACVGFRAVR